MQKQCLFDKIHHSLIRKNRNFLKLIKGIYKKLEFTTNLLEWPKPGIPTTPNADEALEQQELSLTGGGNAKLHRYVGREFGSFLQN